MPKPDPQPTPKPNTAPKPQTQLTAHNSRVNLSEGMVKSGGVNSAPTTPRPSPPPAQGGGTNKTGSGS